MITVTIDGKPVSAERGATVLEAARSAGIDIPTLCHHDGLPPDGNCRLCTVEIDDRGRKKLVASCMYPIKSGISVETKSARVTAARKFIIQLLVNRNPKAIAINELAREYGVVREERFAFGSDLCVRCGRCVRACEVNGTNAIGMSRTGFARSPASPYGEPPDNCVGCVSCAEVCPTGKIAYKDDHGRREIWGRSFELAVCERCGANYATKEHLSFIAENVRLGADGKTEEVESRLCERCRKAVYSAGFKQFR
jgi:NADH dehydrogenase/NADH:ubiquinone oxidoreductase subunit G